MSRTYSRDDLKQAMTDAGLDRAQRHAVYCNLPGEYTRTGLAAAGCKVTLRRRPGAEKETVIVAACTREEVGGGRKQRITVWIDGVMGLTSETFCTTQRCLFLDSACTILVTGATNGPAHKYL